jgi:hypothetical protein
MRGEMPNYCITIAAVQTSTMLNSPFSDSRNAGPFFKKMLFFTPTTKPAEVCRFGETPGF